LAADSGSAAEVGWDLAAAEGWEGSAEAADLAAAGWGSAVAEGLD
jgi:hypothetical protein